MNISIDYFQVFAEPPESLLITLDKKANESVKYKGKKEKRLQRATFREIYNSFEVILSISDYVNRNDCILVGHITGIYD